MESLIVTKFGGSTLGIEGKFIPKIINRIQNLVSTSKVISVFSAPLMLYNGTKRSITDVILDVGNSTAAGTNFDLDPVWSTYEKILSHTDNRHDICNDILKSYMEKTQDTFSQIKTKREFHGKLKSQALAYSGELLIGNLMNEILCVNNVSSTAVSLEDWPIITDHNTEYTNLLRTESFKRASILQNHLITHDVLTMGGFIGKSLDGTITTFERGGSDRTATILALMLEDTYDTRLDFEKDNPVLSTDPHIVSDDLSIISHMSYNEARIASMFGMKILDPIAIKEILTSKSSLPITITDMNDPTRVTHIQQKSIPADNPLKVIAAKHNCVILHISYDLSYKLIQSLTQRKQYSEFIILSPFTNDIDTFARILFLDADYVKLHKDYFVNFDSSTSLTFGRGVLTLVGDDMSKIKQIVSRIATQIGNAGLNILNMDAQEETSRIIIIFNDVDDNIEKAIRVAHKERNNISL